jgi:hypothetical protein
MKKVLRFFDKMEDKARGYMSRRVFVYALVGGALHVLFWRGIWHTSDFIMSGNWHLNETRNFWGWLLYEPITLIWTTSALILIGLFVSIFIGDSIIMSGIKNTKKITEKTEKEISEEENNLKSLSIKIVDMSKDIEEIKTLLKK